MKGSDHCPIWVDLREEIEVDVGGEGGERGKKIVKLRDVMRASGSQAQPPRVAAKYWEEYSGKQTLLSTFFGRGGAGKEAGSSAASSKVAVEDERDGGGVVGEQDITFGSGRDVVPAGGSDMGIPASAPSTVVLSLDPNDEGIQGTTASSLATLSNSDPDSTPLTSSAPAPSPIPTPQQPSPPPPPPAQTKRIPAPAPAAPLSLAQYPFWFSIYVLSDMVWTYVVLYSSSLGTAPALPHSISKVSHLSSIWWVGGALFYLDR